MNEKTSSLRISSLSQKASLTLLETLPESHEQSKAFSDLISFYIEISSLDGPELTPDVIFRLLRLCNTLFLSNFNSEQQRSQLCEISEFFANKVLFFPNESFSSLFLCLYNNMAMVSLQMGELSSAKKYLKQCSDLLQNKENKQLYSLTLNNISSLNLMQGLFTKACQNSEESLNVIEPYIFSLLKSNSESSLRSNQQFINDLHILLNAYLNYSISLQNLQKVPQNFKSHQKVLINGLKIASKFLGESYFLTQRFMVSYNRSVSSKMATNEDSKPVGGFFLKNNYTRGSSSQNKWRQGSSIFQKSSAADFFRKQRNFEESEASMEQERSEPFLLKSRIKEVHFAMQDLKKIRQDYYKERKLIELEKQGLYGDKSAYFLGNYEHKIPRFSSPSMNFDYEKPLLYSNNNNFNGNIAYNSKFSTPIQNPNANKYAGLQVNPLITMEKENQMKEYIDKLEHENNLLRQKKTEENTELERMKVILKEFERKQQNELKNPIFLSAFEANNMKLNSNVNNMNINEITPIAETIDTQPKSETKDKIKQYRGKYATRESRNFKLNLEKLLKLDDPEDNPEVLQRKAIRYKENGNNEAPTNTNPNPNPITKNNQLVKPKLSRATASLDIRSNERNLNLSKNNEKNLNSSKNNSLLSVSRIEEANSEEVLEFFGILSKDIFLQSFAKAFFNEDDDLNEVFISTTVAMGKQLKKEFRFLRTKEEIMLKVVLKENSENEKPLWSLEMNLKSCLDLVRSFELRDVFSPYVPLKTMSTKEDFLRFCIVPFTSVRNHEKGEFGVAFSDKSEGILAQRVVLDFLEEKCDLFLHYINQNEFRAVLTSKENTSKVIRVDLVFDDPSFRKIFKFIEAKSCRSEEIADLVQISEVFEMGEEGQSPVSTKIFKKYIEKTTSERVHQLETVEIINETLLIDKLKLIVLMIENLLKEEAKRSSFDELYKTKGIVLFRARIFEEYVKFRVYILFENIVKDSLEVFLRNGFETHAPEKKMVKTKGTNTFELENLWKKFGVWPSFLDGFDKYALYSIVLDSYYLEVFTKELDPDDYDRFDENAIASFHMEFVGFNRCILGEQKKQPLTLTLFGFDSIPKAIRVTIYDPQDQSEAGMLIIVNERLWRKNQQQKLKLTQGKRTKKYMAILPMEENYHLPEILKKSGYPILKSRLVIEKNEEGFEIFAKSLMKEKNRMESLENLLTLSAVLEYYKNNDPDTL